MNFDGDFGNAEVGGHLFVQVAGHDQLHHFAFPQAEGLQSLLESLLLSALAQGRAAGLQRIRDGSDCLGRPQGFGQKFAGAGFHGPHGRGDVRLAAHEDDRHLDPVQHPLLQLETAQPGQPQLNQQTTGLRKPRLRQEFLRRVREPGLPTRSPDLPGE